MENNMKKLMEIVSGSEELMNKLKELAAKQAAPAELVAFAAELGVELSEEDFKQPGSGELSDEELAQAAGGRSFWDWVTCVLGISAIMF